LIPALPAAGQAASVLALEATQDGRLRYKAILSFVNDIKVVAQTDGIILDILVDDGTAVSKDTILIQIDNRLAVAEREVASKELESAKLKAEDDSQIKVSVASYEVATSVFNRSQELFAKVVEAQEELVNSKATEENSADSSSEFFVDEIPVFRIHPALVRRAQGRRNRRLCHRDWNEKLPLANRALADFSSS
jgi:multidrug efflux pump subunit AcrA (membrane-fusion protein)